MVSPIDDEALVARAECLVPLLDELGEDVLALAVERDRVVVDDEAEARELGRGVEAARARDLEREETVLRAQRKHVLAVDRDVPDLSRVHARPDLDLALQ